MSNNWNNYQLPPSGNGDMLKIEDGKPVKVQIYGEPYVCQSEYQGNLSTRFALKLWNHDAQKAQFLLIPKTAFVMITDFAKNPEWGDPEQYPITLKRTGTGRETEWSVQPSPNKQPLTKLQQDEVSTIDLKIILDRLPSISLPIPLSEANDAYYKQTVTVPTDDLPPLEAYSDLEAELNDPFNE